MEVRSKSIIVGTAGHIDHGKTSLVKALTGIDADRLEEEKRRGITIDLGFAHMELPGVRVGFVDVPGHERFVRNMLAGAGGVDVVLLIIAADEGVMPQTHEHFEICRLLGVERGIVVLTKSDLVDSERLAEARAEAEALVRGSFLDLSRTALVPVSATSGAGLEVLKAEITKAASEVQAKSGDALLRLPIDRVFVMKGFGTVVTGTLISGSIGKEDEVEIFPSRRRARVRSVQVHGTEAERAHAGERTALNLPGIGKEDLTRGMTLAAPGTWVTTTRFDVELSLLRDARPLPDHAQVHLHLHSLETVAEVILYEGAVLPPGKSAFAQLRVRGPLLTLPGDRFIIRHFSPVETIGGGVVLDNAPSDKRMKPNVAREILTRFKDGTQAEIMIARVERRGASGLALRQAVCEMGIPLAQLQNVASSVLGEGMVLRFGDVLIASKHFRGVQELMAIAVKAFHDRNPLVGGINRQELKERLRIPSEIFEAGLASMIAGKRMEIHGDQVRTAGRIVVMKEEEVEAKQTIERAFSSAGLKVPALKDVLAGLPLEKARAQQLVTLLLRDRVLVKLADDLVFHQSALDALRAAVRAQKAKSARMDVAAFKELTGVTRKYAIPLLEMLDRERITRREGDVRVIL